MQRRTWSLIAAILGSGVVFLDGTVVTVALAAIGEQLPRVTSIGVLEAQSYVYNAYMLSLAALLIVGGVLSDTKGRRRMYRWGLLGFGAATALCGLAPNMETLIVARFLQGVGGAVLIPGSLALINAAYQGEDRSRAFGIWAGATAGVTIAGPLIGGVLVDLLSWRAAFLATLPILGVAWWVTYAKVGESADVAAGEAIDWVGAGLAGLAVAGLSFGPIRGQETNWQDPTAWALIGAGTIAAAALVRRIMRHPGALVPRSLFTNRNFSVLNVATFFVYGGLYVLLVMPSIFFQGTLGYNATTAGLATVPTMLPMALFSGRIGSVSASRPRPFLAAGPILMALGALWLAAIPATSEAWIVQGPSTWLPPADYFRHVLGGVSLVGVGLTLMVTPLTTALMASIPPARAGVGSAFNNAVSRIGPQLVGGLAVVLVTATFFGRLATLAPDLPPVTVRSLSPLNTPADLAAGLAGAVGEASTAGFSRAMWLVAGLLVAGAGVSAIGLRAAPQLEGATGRQLAGQLCIPTEVESV